MVLYWAKVVALLALAAFLSFGCYFWWVSSSSEKQLTAQSSAVLTHLDSYLNQTFDNINRDCGTGKPCGLISNINKTVVKAGDAIVQTQIVEKKITETIAPHVTTAMDNIGSAGKDLGNSAKSLGKTSDELTKTLQITNDKKNGLPAIFENANGTITDLREQLKSQAVQNVVADISRAVHFSADTTENVAGITKDLKLEADKLAAPKTKTQKILQWAPAGAKVGITVTCALLGPC